MRAAHTLDSYPQSRMYKFATQHVVGFSRFLPSFLEDLPAAAFAAARCPGRWNRKSRSGVGNWSENRGLTLPVFQLRQTANQDLPALPGAKRGYALRVAR